MTLTELQIMVDKIKQYDAYNLSAIEECGKKIQRIAENVNTEVKDYLEYLKGT